MAVEPCPLCDDDACGPQYGSGGFSWAAWQRGTFGAVTATLPAMADDFTATGRVFDENGVLLAVAGDSVPGDVAKRLGLTQGSEPDGDGNMVPGAPGPKRAGRPKGAKAEQTQTLSDGPANTERDAPMPGEGVVDPAPDTQGRSAEEVGSIGDATHAEAGREDEGDEAAAPNEGQAKGEARAKHGPGEDRAAARGENR
jgi:hypothetical protein